MYLIVSDTSIHNCCSALIALILKDMRRTATTSITFSYKVEKSHVTVLSPKFLLLTLENWNSKAYIHQLVNRTIICKKHGGRDTNSKVIR